VLRLAVPLQRWTQPWCRCAGGFLGVAGASWSRSSAGLFFSATFTYRIRRLQSFAENLLTSVGRIILADATDELGALARSLSTMADQLRRMVQPLERGNPPAAKPFSPAWSKVCSRGSGNARHVRNESFTRAVGAVVPALRRPPLPSWSAIRIVSPMLNRVLVSGEPVKQRMEVPPPAALLRVQAAPARHVFGSRRHGHPARHPRTSNASSACARISSPMYRTSCDPPAAIQGYTETLLDAPSRTRSTTVNFWRSFSRTPSAE